MPYSLAQIGPPEHHCFCQLIFEECVNAKMILENNAIIYVIKISSKTQVFEKVHTSAANL